MALELPEGLANELADWLERENARCLLEEAEAIRLILSGRKIEFVWNEDELGEGE